MNQLDLKTLQRIFQRIQKRPTDGKQAEIKETITDESGEVEYNVIL